MHHFFDLGGTLIDSVARKEQTAKEYGSQRGIETFKLLNKIDISSTRTRDLLNHLLGGRVSDDELSGEYEIFRKIEQDIEATIVPGAEEFLDYLSYSGDKLCLVTNSRVRNCISEIRGNIPSTIRGYFTESNIFCRINDSEPKKPNPLLYKKALRSVGVDISSVIAYEDTRRGLQAAVKSGITNCIGVLSSNLHSNERLLRNGAQIVINNYSELLITD